MSIKTKPRPLQMKHTAKAGVYAGKLFCESGFDVGKDGIAALTADKDDFAGGG